MSKSEFYIASVDHHTFRVKGSSPTPKLRCGGQTAHRAQNLVGEDVVRFARNYASDWENLKVGGTGSPLGQAAARYFPKIAAQKYHEIGNYPTQIVARAAG